MFYKYGEVYVLVELEDCRWILGWVEFYLLVGVIQDFCIDDDRRGFTSLRYVIRIAVGFTGPRPANFYES